MFGLSLILSTIILSSCFATYETITFSEEEAVYRIFENLDNTQNELFIKANDWMVSNFNDATSVIEFSDKESGTLIGKYKLAGTISTGMYGTSIDTRVYAKIDIRVRDNKAKISILPLGSWKYDYSGLTIYNYTKENAIEDINKLIDSFGAKLKSVGDDF